ncbi:hypothetical protein J7J62_02305 [bacterium]|nr:hypothetical protein [bacterium]
MCEKITAILKEENFKGKWEFLPAYSVGIKGDNRIYGKVIELIPESKWDYEIVGKIAQRLCNEIKDICRVTIRI